MWTVDGNMSESYSVNKFATSDFETSHFVTGVGIFFSNKLLYWYRNILGSVNFDKPSKAKWNSPDTVQPLRRAAG